MNALWRPAASAERYQHIDAIRGLALFGVLIVNAMTMFRVPLLEHISGSDADRGWVGILLEFKAVTIFTFLFGVGIAMQAERAAGRVGVLRFLTRRLAWLFVFGVVHLLAIFNGDILALYAICGLMLLPFLRLPGLALFVLGAVVMFLPEVVPMGLPIPVGGMAAVHIARAREIYGGGSFWEILSFRYHETWSLIVPLLVSVLPRTAGIMLWGVAAWRSGVLQRPEQHRVLLGILFAAGLATAVGTKAEAPIVVAAVYVSGLLLLLPLVGSPSAFGLADAGRMALTNYLLQSVVLGFIFYGYGLGLLGRLAPAAAIYIGIGLYGMQVLLSHMWLRHFRFGPFEWLWRLLTYGRRNVV